MCWMCRARCLPDGHWRAQRRTRICAHCQIWGSQFRRFCESAGVWLFLLFRSCTSRSCLCNLGKLKTTFGPSVTFAADTRASSIPVSGMRSGAWLESSFRIWILGEFFSEFFWRSLESSGLRFERTGITSSRVQIQYRWEHRSSCQHLLNL